MATETKDKLAVPLKCSGYPEGNPLAGTDRTCIIDDTGNTIACMCPAEQAREMAHRCNLYNELVGFVEEMIGFAVNLRQTDSNWQDHQDVGVMFAKATTLLAKAWELKS